MKKKYLVLFTIILIIVLLISAFINSGKIGDTLYEHNFLELSRFCYKISYFRTKDHELIKKIFSTLKVTDYEENIYYGKIIIENNYFYATNLEFIKTVRFAYLYSLYEVGNMEDFSIKYNEFYNATEGEYFSEKLNLFLLIAYSDRVYEKKNYEFIINECEQIHSIYKNKTEKSNKDKSTLIDIYIILGNMYEKTGNKDMAKKYNDLANKWP